MISGSRETERRVEDLKTIDWNVPTIGQKLEPLDWNDATIDEDLEPLDWNDIMYEDLDPPDWNDIMYEDLDPPDWNDIMYEDLDPPDWNDTMYEDLDPPDWNDTAENQETGLIYYDSLILYHGFFGVISFISKDGVPLEQKIRFALRFLQGLLYPMLAVVGVPSKCPFPVINSVKPGYLYYCSCHLLSTAAAFVSVECRYSVINLPPNR
ncbi:hypothetical protein scyTo_0011278 [Scyliorhinus torazame]|uniref:Uncharacterized protein n=1 Tax=Scyliorhinus torazame TaxID=75743 RepID=A0A401NJX9_SCYTO|nr:hypothetical protein [Scyliorhinus torazame]